MEAKTVTMWGKSDRQTSFPSSVATATLIVPNDGIYRYAAAFCGKGGFGPAVIVVDMDDSSHNEPKEWRKT